MTLRSVLIVTWILAVLLGSMGAAHAQVTNVSVMPSPAIVGQPATVTVSGGSAPCGAVEINYGDTTVITYPISVLPFQQTHIWTTTGNKTVVATGQGNCTGQASATVGVVRSRIGAGVGVNKSGPPKYTLPMRIKSYFGLSQPGGLAAIAGEHFGAERGSVVAKLRRWTGVVKDVPLNVNGWSPTLIEVQWPADIVGVRDQMDAVVEVTDATNTKTAGWKVFFRAETDYKLLPMSELSLVTCGDDGNYNACNNTARNGQSCPSYLGIQPGMPVCAGSFRGFHHNCDAAIGNDEGTDEFAVQLRNDWVISGVDFKRNISGGGGVFKNSEGSVWSPSPQAPTGHATWNPRVKWEVTPGDSVSYCAFVHISGPKGVPY